MSDSIRQDGLEPPDDILELKELTTPAPNAATAQDVLLEPAEPLPLPEWSWGRMFIRHWTAFCFVACLMVHISCLTVLQIFESKPNSPSLVFTIASRVMYTNVLLMCLAVFLESYAYCKRLVATKHSELLDGDYDAPMTSKDARKDLGFMSNFATHRWRKFFRLVGLACGLVLKYGSILLAACALANVVRIFIPTGMVPDTVSKYVQFSLAIISLLDLLAALLVVFNWVYVNYDKAKQRMSGLLIQGSS